MRGSIREEITCQLLGQVLTIIDSSIIDKQQNKAVKDLIKGHFANIIYPLISVLKEDIYKLAEKNGQPIKGDQGERFEL